MTTHDDALTTTVAALTHNQMLEKAREIHPKATLELDEVTNEWRIVINTLFTQEFELDPEFEGTPAWELFNETDSSYGDSLSRWMHKNGVHGTLHEGATVLNREARAWQEKQDKFNDAVRASGHGAIVDKMNAGGILTDEEAELLAPLWKILGW